MVKAKKQTLFDTFEINGYWWLPNSEKKVPGILYFSNEHIRLELLGSLREDNLRNLFRSMDSDRDTDDDRIILGISDEGEEFTILDALNTNSKLSQGFTTEIYSVNVFLVGGHFNSSSEIEFHSFSMYPTYFTKWKSEPKYNQSLLYSSGKLSNVNSIEFIQNDRFSFYVEKNKLTIEEAYRTQFTGDIFESLGWKYKGGFKIEPDEFKSFEWMNKILFQLRDLYSLFVGYPTYLENITFYGELDTSLSQEQPTRQSYDLFFKQRNVNIREKFGWSDVLLNHNDISDKFSDIINNWFLKEDVLKTVVDIHISDYYIDSYLDTKFLNSVQALEIYHRRVSKGTLIKSDDFEKYSKKTLDFVKENASIDFAEKIEGMLLHGNEYSLSKRLREIINSLDSETKAYLFGNSKKKDKFIQQLVDTRNYRTHYDEAEKKHIIKDHKMLYFAIQRLKAIITIILFKELGVPEDILLKKIKQSKQFSYTIGKAKKIFS